ncbi:ras-related protein Rab-4B isoform X2 [Coccinella septempunctata]|uniref:ras-related protein Rab-4B isoform X2 n=1 Tax=Coccinella septempunctata TaxID=41139 RepID=UPI001D094B8F|nr:ras-related protein Rab-4B isoform X2 [Coccinella septempunctata]
MAMVKIPEQKVILCGEYATDRRSTLGLDNFDKVYSIGDKDIKLQLWDTGGMERVASITSSYYKFSEAAILVFSLDNPSSFHTLSQHLLDIVTYAETAKIFLCGNKSDLVGEPPQITEAEIESFCEQCQSLITNTYQISCKTNEGVEEMFTDIAFQLVNSNRARLELQSMEKHGFKITQSMEELSDESCLC